MSVYAQYNEEEIFANFFNSKPNGFIVEVGAADGVVNSNSRFLIQSLNWSGILVEPVPLFFEKLIHLYSDNSQIKLINKAIFNTKLVDVDFFLYSGGEQKDTQVSTLAHEFKEKVEALYGKNYTVLKTNTTTLEDIFITNKVDKNFDLLSVDCEGADMIVLQSNNWEKFRPNLICVEHSMQIQELINYMTSIDYTLYTRNEGNTFFTKIDRG